MTKPRSPLAESLNALGAGTVHSHVIAAISGYPGLKHLGADYDTALYVANAFNDQQMLEMARLVMANAAIDNKKALQRAHVASVLGKNPKAAKARITSEKIKAGLLKRAGRYLEKSQEKDPAATARQIRRGPML